MVDLGSVKDALFGKLSETGLTSGEFLANVLVAVVLVIVGIFLGKIIKFGLRKFFERINVDKIVKHSFVELFLMVIKWSIYILFIDIALIQLGIPSFTKWLTTILGVIPALTGALIIISVGFAIAVYLKNVIVESRVEGWNMLSQIFFYFVMYIFMILAFRTAFISLQDKVLANILIVIFTALGGIALLIYFVQNKR
ncbi:hypothetical protein COV15_01135 [Candidatus Woesearchaeota archaeon CG10_big_fil_rev_8_21_14_0_10_34_12]|nr:MAG: hypothetical protein COV15_01135 [Candidatus Woesearchaeota archaeon CG10_big_fil_rev_8_21_14_0_10_34_12]